MKCNAYIKQYMKYKALPPAGAPALTITVADIETFLLDPI